jgi:phosphatidate cytidylyltransferase
MLRWRLLLGTLIIAALAGLCWLDSIARLPGVWLMPLAVVFTLFAAAETAQLITAATCIRKGDRSNLPERPDQPSVGARCLAQIGPVPFSRGLVYCGCVLILLSNWIPVILARCSAWPWPAEGALSWQQAMALAAWPAAALMLCSLALFIDEMRLFQKPGQSALRLASSALTLVYVGLLTSFLVQLRLAYGVGTLVSVIVVVKMGDTGAYLVGHLIGRHKMSPVISPGKTWEGAAGAVFFACLGAWLCWLLPMTPASYSGTAPSKWSWIAYGILVGVAGIFGDLAESLLKRDAGRKDSSTWMPGFGGVLDVLDSLLFAAPVGWIFWIVHTYA